MRIFFFAVLSICQPVPDVFESFFRFSSSDLVDPFQFVGVFFRVADIQGFRGADDEGCFVCFPFVDLVHLAVVHMVAVLHSFEDLRGFLHEGLHEGQVCGRLAVAFGLGEDDDVAVIAQLFHIGIGHGVGDAAVQVSMVLDCYRPGDYRHGSGGTEPAHVLFLPFVAAAEDAFAGVHVRGPGVEGHGVVFVGFPVKGVQDVRELPVAEVRAVEVAGGNEGPEAAVTFVLAVLFVVAVGAADLAGLEVASEDRPGGDARRAVKSDFVFHEDVDDAAGEQAAHGAAFHDQCGLHCGSSFSIIQSSIRVSLPFSSVKVSRKTRSWTPWPMSLKT